MRSACRALCLLLGDGEKHRLSPGPGPNPCAQCPGSVGQPRFSEAKLNYPSGEARGWSLSLTCYIPAKLYLQKNVAGLLLAGACVVSQKTRMKQKTDARSGILGPVFWFRTGPTLHCAQGNVQRAVLQLKPPVAKRKLPEKKYPKQQIGNNKWKQNISFRGVQSEVKHSQFSS